MAQTSLSKAGLALLFVSKASGVSLDSGFKPCFTFTVIPGRSIQVVFVVSIPWRAAWRLPDPAASFARAEEPEHRALITTHHRRPTVTQDGWLGSQSLLLHDAGGGDGEGDEVKCNYDCQVCSEHQHLGSWDGERDKELVKLLALTSSHHRSTF